MSLRFVALKSLVQADERATDGRGWSFNLDIFRIVFLATAVFPFAFRNLIWIENILPSLPRTVWTPVSFYRVIPFELVTSVGPARVLAFANLALILLGLAGLFTRQVIGCATLASVYLFGLMENQGKVDHFHHLIWFMALLAIGPSGRFLSIDSIRGAIRRADCGSVEPPAVGFDALWILRYVWLLLGLLSLIPGIAKLEKAVTAGWSSAGNLSNIIWAKWLELLLYVPGATLPPRADLLPPPLLHLAGIGVIAFEIGFIFLCLFRRSRLVAAFAGLMFHTGNGIILNIWFTTLIPAYVALIDWAFLLRKLDRNQALLMVLYDGQCRMCRRTMAILKSLDVGRILYPKEVTSEFKGLEEHPDITFEAVSRDLLTIQGAQVRAGYDAYVQIARRLVLLWPVAVLMQLPFIDFIGRKVYRRIADSRSCALITSSAASRRERASAMKPSWLHTIVIAILVCQLSVSSMLFLYDELPNFVGRLPGPARHLVRGFAGLRPVWPYDHYPTFSYRAANDVEIWEARWVLRSGGEVRATPRAYDVAFGNSGMIWSMVNETCRQPASDRCQAKSSQLVRTLWRSESSAVRSTVIGVRVYRARYWLGFDDLKKALQSQVFVGEFPIGSVSQ